MDTGHWTSWLLLFWIALVGGAVGSFINVVVYRLPRGQSLVHPGSQCPACKHPIRARHNVPVLGWLMLGGRCYDCRAKIAGRYPVVEAITSAMFVALALAGPFALAEGPSVDDPEADSWWMITRWGLYVYHVFFMCTLLSLTLMELEQSQSEKVRFPWRMFIAAILIGLLLPLGWSWFGPSLSGDILPGVWAEEYLARAVYESMTGIVAAVLLMGWPTMIRAGYGSGDGCGRSWAAGNLVLVGVFLGSMAVKELAACTALFFLITAGLARLWPEQRRLSWSLYLFMLTLFWLAVWKPMVGWLSPFQPAADLYYQIALFASAVVLTLITIAITPRGKRLP